MSSGLDTCLFLAMHGPSGLLQEYGREYASLLLLLHHLQQCGCAKQGGALSSNRDTGAEGGVNREGQAHASRKTGREPMGPGLYLWGPPVGRPMVPHR